MGWWLGGLGGLLLIGWGILSTHRMLHPLPRFLVASPVSPSPRTYSVTSDDADRFDVWALEAPKPRGLIITCHGYRANRLQLVAIAEGLYQRGYTALLFDLRGHGSRRGRCTFGLVEIRDIKALLTWRAQRPDLAALPVGVLGLSFGGAIACLAAQRYHEIGAVVVDSSYARLFPIMVRSIRAQYHLPTAGAWVTWWCAQLVLRRLFAPIDPVVIGARSRQPILVIHGMQDQTVPVDHAHQLYAHWQGPKDQWLEPQVGHVEMSLVHPEAYRDRVGNFFDRWLPTVPQSSPC